MHKTTTTLAVLCAICALTADAQNFNPVPLTPGSFTQDIIVESNTPPPAGSPANYGLTATVGNGTGLGDNTFFETGLRRGYFGGLPTNGATFTHKSKLGIQYVMPGDYKTNNCMLIDGGVTSGSLAFVSSTTVTNLSFLGTGGGGSVTVNYTVNHADASTDTGTITFVDWFNGANYAWTNSGRITVGGTYNNISDGGGNPRLYSSEITVSSASPVTSVDFSYNTGQHANIFAISGNSTGTWTPIPVTGFNHKVIVPASFPVTATMDQGTNTAYNGNLATWFEKGFATPSGYPNSGLPHPGEYLTNVNFPTHIYQMAASYSANNAILIDTNNQTANITPANPTNYTAFALLTAGGNVGGANIMTNLVIMQHANGVQETNLFFGYDWFANNAQIAYVTGGRVNLGSRTVDSLANPITLANNPKLFESTFGLLDTASPVTNIVLKFKSSPGVSSTTYVLAVSATAGAVAPVIASQTPFLNVFNGSNATFNVQVSAGSPPLTYIWQTNDVTLGNGGKVSGATTTNLTLTGVDVSDENSYVVIVTNTAGAVTSAPIVLTVLSTNTDVTLPGDLITSFGGTVPANEAVTNAINDTTSKYLNFGGNNGASPFAGPVGFVVTPSQGSSIVTGLRVYAANDASERDPIDYTIEGSTDGVSFTSISSGSLALPTTRNSGNAPLAPLSQSLDEVRFVNASLYSSYRVSFINVRDNSTANSMQLGDVELLGTLSATAATITVDVHPTNVTAFEGVMTTLSLTAVGTPPLYYQWKQNGSDVSGATNASYSFPTSAGSNTYSCSISNAIAPATNSATATVVGVALTPATTFALNFHDAQNFAAGGPPFDATKHIAYVGQGAYADVGNSNWNGWLSDGGMAGPTATSGGIMTSVSLILTNLGFNDGGIYQAPYPDGFGGNTLQGTPGFLLGENAAVDNGNVGGFILTNVPSGLYNLYLYSANFNNDLGAKFTVGGITTTVNNDTNFTGLQPGTNFVAGLNYTVFQNLVPSNGVISGTWDGVFTNSISGLSGEGCFNGLQLVKVPTPSVTLTIVKSGADTIVSWLPAVGQLQAANLLTGTYTNVVGSASPYTNTPSATQTYFRVKVQ